MTDSAFQRRLKVAIESRQSLDSLRSASAECDPEDKQEWNRQIQLDLAIDAWKRAKPRRPTGRIFRSRRGTWGLSTIALGFGLWGSAFYFGTEEGSHGVQFVQHPPTILTNAPLHDAVVAPLPTNPREPVPLAVAHFASPSELEPPPIPSARYAEISETTDRLVYAFEPVGQRVTAVVQRLIDAVPGADVLANWQHES